MVLLVRIELTTSPLPREFFPVKPLIFLAFLMREMTVFAVRSAGTRAYAPAQRRHHESLRDRRRRARHPRDRALGRRRCAACGHEQRGRRTRPYVAGWRRALCR